MFKHHLTHIKILPEAPLFLLLQGIFLLSSQIISALPPWETQVQANITAVQLYFIKTFVHSEIPIKNSSQTSGRRIMQPLVLGLSKHRDDYCN